MNFKPKMYITLDQGVSIRFSHRHLRKIDWLMSCTSHLVCLVSIVSGCRKNVLGRGNTSRGHIKNLSNILFFRYLWFQLVSEDKWKQKPPWFNLTDEKKFVFCQKLFFFSTFLAKKRFFNFFCKKVLLLRRQYQYH